MSCPLTSKAIKAGNDHGVSSATKRSGGLVIADSAPIPAGAEEVKDLADLPLFDRMRYDMCREKGGSDRACRTMLPHYHT